jgi:hypothetical protein
MAEYVSFDPKVEVLGAAIMSVVAGIGDTAIPILKKYELYPLDKDGWYSQQSWLDAFRELKKADFLNEVSIGMKIPDEAQWPPDIKTVKDALTTLNVAYHMNHRNGEIGGYHFTATSDNEGVMVCENPYPSDFDYGIIYRTVQKFREQGNKAFRVKLDDSKPSRKKGANSCTYLINW